MRQSTEFSVHILTSARVAVVAVQTPACVGPHSTITPKHTQGSPPNSVYTSSRAPGLRWLLRIRLYALVTASGLRRTNGVSPGRAVSDGGGVCVIGSTIGSVRISITNGCGGSGTRRGAFGSIRIHIRRGRGGQRLYALSAASGLRRTNGVLAFMSPVRAISDGGGFCAIGVCVIVSSTLAYARKEGGYAFGSGGGRP